MLLYHDIYIYHYFKAGDNRTVTLAAVLDSQTRFTFDMGRDKRKVFQFVVCLLDGIQSLKCVPFSGNCLI